MKQKLLLISALFFGASVNAQVYFTEDFSAGLGAWTLTDSDGDGFEWQTVDYGAGDGQGEVATSASWDANAGPLNPDNWLVSPAIVVPNAASVLLTWKVYAQDQGWAAENYTVYVATAGDIATLSASTTSFNEVLTTSNGYMSRSLDVSAMAGSTIYIGFRHHNVTDQFRMNIDDIAVQTLAQNEIEILSVSNAKYAFGSTTITGTVRNNGAATITSFDLDWNDGTSHNATISGVSIPNGATYDFSHTTPLMAVGGTTHALTVTATIPNDAVPANNSINAEINGVTSVVERVTVGEEKTGTWCGWCPRGTVAMADMEATPNFIGIAVHNGDPMAFASYDNNIGTYVPGGYPGAGVDRVVTGDPSDFLAMHTEREAVIAPGTIQEVDAQLVGNNIEVKVTADFVANMSGDNRIAVVVLEDNVTGTTSGYDQVNFYSSTAANIPLVGAGIDWQAAANPVPAALMDYDHVARALGGNEILGVAGSLPASISAGDSEVYTYTIPMNSSWDNSELSFAAMIVDGVTGEIYNAGKSKVLYSLGIEEEVSTFGVSVFPNPVSDIAQIQVNLEEDANVDVTIYNTAGSVVYSNLSNTLGAGAFVYTVDVKDLAKGLYLVNTTVNGKTKTTKLSVQ